MAKNGKGKSQKNANYGFERDAPPSPMGSGSFANLPSDPMYMTVSGTWDMRDGLRNSPVTSVDEISKVKENMR